MTMEYLKRGKPDAVADPSYRSVFRRAPEDREGRMDTIRALLADHIGRTRQACGNRAGFLEDTSAA